MLCFRPVLSLPNAATSNRWYSVQTIYLLDILDTLDVPDVSWRPYHSNIAADVTAANAVAATNAVAAANAIAAAKAVAATIWISTLLGSGYRYC